ncbi:hypothetical protein ACO2Q0_03055 [Phenylobacterium sp. VNQ135]|uniref:hypothetical protein n=1 Tax=Phenylobacterium sp. VNQ135 TaxID=3400922 RepID=UPI003C0F5C1C
MAGRSNKTMSWDDVDRFSAASTPLRPSDPATNPFRAKTGDPKAFRPMTIDEHIALADAPKRPGTRVTVRAYDTPWPGRDEHMYTEYDDGREQYIYRGGPSLHGVHAQLTPARESPDYGKGGRVLYRTDLPGVTARTAIGPAQAEGERIERSGAPYRVFYSNSNGVVADGTEAQFGIRVGDERTPGWETPIEARLPRRGVAPRREY